MEHRAAEKPKLAIEDLGCMAPIFLGLGDYEKVVSLQQEAYQLAVDNHLKEQQKQCSRNLVSGLFHLGEYAEVLNWFQKVNIDFFASSRYIAYSRLAGCHLHLNHPDSARFYLEKMVQGSEKDRDELFYSRIAETYLAENREDAATTAIGKMMVCFREQAKTNGETETGSTFPFNFLPVLSSYATLLHHNGKNREALESFRRVEPLMEETTKEDAVLADQMEALTRYSTFCRSMRQYEKVSDLLVKRDSLREIYNDIITRRDSKRVTDRFKSQELLYTISLKASELNYSNRMLISIAALALVLICSLVIVIILYRQRQKQLGLLLTKDKELQLLRSTQLHQSPSAVVLNPKEELFHIVENKVVSEELFLNKELTLDMLAAELATNRSYLSSCINTYSGGNFSQWINNFRIRYAVEHIHSTYSFAQLADEAGFMSIDPFYRNFKRCMGMTPSEYVKQK